ncbi:Gti1/Pac2 family-domain-containing protein [Gymnopilus junonius]|uniref:Gti1/Pac2 family-domain-containing protein n=1 Tax=Gymnopilus junonius TaxID=109634 RepID=A0A9P5TMN5_GYMJU|nr:Gti1/Pac2 family-domain-containing protein [Gymnopilus junonius]
MQRATLTGIRIRSPVDARVIFHSVFLNIFPIVTRRLDTEERGLITTGSVYVWEERGPQAELTGVGIERWTDGIRWGPSRVREGFLFYHEKPSQQLYVDNMSPSYDASRSILTKQTYTVYVDTPRGRRKWHLIAYFTEETVSRLRTIDDIPQLANLTVPHGKYKSARSAKGRPEHIFNAEPDSSTFSHLEYVPYAPRASPPTVSPSIYQQDSWSDSSLPEPMPYRSGPASSKSDNSKKGQREVLVPLSYLEDHPPPRRHPTDEKVLMLLTSRGFGDKLLRPNNASPRIEG